MANTFNTPCTLANPDDFVVSEVIDTAGIHDPLDIEMTGGTWASGWHAPNTIALGDDAMVTATVGDEAGCAFMIGFDATNPDEHYNTIDYAVYPNVSSGIVYVYENSAFMASAGAAPQAGDTVSVRKTGTTIEYLYNGSVFYTSGVAVPGSLVLDNTFRNLPSTMKNVTLEVNGARELVVPSSYVGSALIEHSTAGFDLVRDSLNYAVAYGQAAPLFNQSFKDAAIYDQTAMQTVCEWQTHLPSDEHQAVEIKFEAESFFTGGGTVRFISLSSGANVDTAVPIGKAVYTIVLPVGMAGWDYGRITMALQVAGALDTLKVYWVKAQYVALTSPLPTYPIESGHSSEYAWPLGEEENGAFDRPLSASKAHHIIDTVEHLYARPECIATWSGTQNTTLVQVMQPDLYRWIWLMTPGGFNRTAGPGGRGRLRNKIRFYVNAKPDAVVDTYVYFQIGGSFTSASHRITIPSGGLTAWFILDVELSLDPFDHFGTFPYPATYVGLWPTQRGDENRTDANVYGFAAFAI